MAYEISLEGKVAVVTGGGGGIGSAISRTLAEAGASVVLTYRQSKEKTEALAESLPGKGHLAVQATVDESASLTRLAGIIEERYGKLDILVNNAGFTKQVDHDNLDDLDDDLIDSIFRTNWRGAFACIRALKTLLSAGEGGVIVNISSIAGRTGIGSNVAYCASKAAMDSMTRSLGRALAPQIRVVSVAPGWTEGPMAARMDPEMIQGQLDRIPMGRLGKPEDAANAVLAAAALLTFTSGSIIPVDGARPFI